MQTQCELYFFIDILPIGLTKIRNTSRFISKTKIENYIPFSTELSLSISLRHICAGYGDRTAGHANAWQRLDRTSAWSRRCKQHMQGCKLPCQVTLHTFALSRKLRQESSAVARCTFRPSVPYRACVQTERKEARHNCTVVIPPSHLNPFHASPMHERMQVL